MFNEVYVVHREFVMRLCTWWRYRRDQWTWVTVYFQCAFHNNNNNHQCNSRLRSFTSHLTSLHFSWGVCEQLHMFRVVQFTFIQEFMFVSSFFSPHNLWSEVGTSAGWISEMNILTRGSTKKLTMFSASRAQQAVCGMETSLILRIPEIPPISLQIHYFIFVENVMAVLSYFCCFAS